MADSRVQVKLLLTLAAFDEIYGPKIIYAYPNFTIPFLNSIYEIVPHLMDVDLAEIKAQPFIYADEKFISVNHGFFIHGTTTRAQKTEYLVSIIASPADPRALIAISGLKTFMSTLKSACYDDPDAIEETFENYYSEILLFFRSQLDAWGYGAVDIRDFQ